MENIIQRVDIKVNLADGNHFATSINVDQDDIATHGSVAKFLKAYYVGRNFVYHDESQSKMISVEIL